MKLNKIEESGIIRSFNMNSIVLTTGVFDILHPGHIDLLYRAKKYGRNLVVGLNSDISYKKYKPHIPGPINGIEHRMNVIAALEMVKCVTWFDEENPIELIKIIRPHVHIKGGDWKPEHMPEYEITKSCGGQTFILSLHKDFSTTNIVKRVKELYCE